MFCVLEMIVCSLQGRRKGKEAIIPPIWAGEV